MKAVILKDFGGVENLIMKEIPVPEILESEVLIRVKAIGINPVDIKTRKGKSQADRLKTMDPIILGWDISGIVTQTGMMVTEFKKGDEVFGMINFPGHGKAYAEYVAAPESNLALKPSNISHEEAAAASLSALTAWQILKEKVTIHKNDKVLIHSAAGGVGHFAVQMAKHLGAEVTGTSSATNRDFVMQLGASRHIDYEHQRFEEILHDMDFVLDSIGGEYSDRSLIVLKTGGTIICIPSGSSENLKVKAAAIGITGSGFLVKSDGRNIKEIAGLLEKGIIKSYISKKYNLTEIQAAHQQIETGKTKGKIVISL